MVKCSFRSCLAGIVSEKNEMILTNREWTDELKDPSSESHRRLANILITDV